MASHSSTYKKKINRVTADSFPVYALEIDHEDLAVPIRVVNNHEDLTIEGNLYIAFNFRINPPDDTEDGLPKAQLEMDNVGSLVMGWLETAQGGYGATCRIMEVYPETAHTTIEWEMTMNLQNVSATPLLIQGDLGFEDILNVPGIGYSYVPHLAPGLFTN